MPSSSTPRLARPPPSAGRRPANTGCADGRRPARPPRTRRRAHSIRSGRCRPAPRRATRAMGSMPRAADARRRPAARASRAGSRRVAFELPSSTSTSRADVRERDVVLGVVRDLPDVERRTTAPLSSCPEAAGPGIPRRRVPPCPRGRQELAEIANRPDANDKEPCQCPAGERRRRADPDDHPRALGHVRPIARWPGAAAAPAPVGRTRPDPRRQARLLHPPRRALDGSAAISSTRPGSTGRSGGAFVTPPGCGTLTATSPVRRLLIPSREPRASRSASRRSTFPTPAPVRHWSRSRRAGSATPTCTTARAGSTTSSRSCSATRPQGWSRRSGTT